MDAVPSLPPYAHITQEATQCVGQASARYEVPELLLHSILMKENGRTGKCSRPNNNGSKDCGLAQINTDWNEFLARFKIRPEDVRDDACTNIYVSAYILRTYYNQKEGDWFKAIVSYNIGPNKWTNTRYSIGYKYATDVVNYWWGFQRWVDHQHGVYRKDAPPAYHLSK